ADGNLPKVKQLLAEWADPNTPNTAKDGHPPLHAVLLRPQGLQPVHLDIVRALVDMDADLTLTTTMPAGESRRTFTLVHSALHSKSGQALKILAAAGLEHDGKPLSQVLEAEALRSEEQEESIWSLLGPLKEERVRLLDASLVTVGEMLALGATPGQVKALHHKAGLETPEKLLQQVVLKGLGPKELGEKLRADPDFLTPTLPWPPFDAVREALQEAPADLRKDRDVVLACISHDAACVADAPEDLRSERCFLLDAVQRHPRALEFAGGFREACSFAPQLESSKSSDKSTHPSNLAERKRFLAHETTKAREDRDFVADAMCSFGEVVGNHDDQVLEFAGGLRSDRQLAFEAVQHAPWVLDLLDAQLQHDPVLAFRAAQAQFATPASEALPRCGTRDVDFAQMSELRIVQHGSKVCCACTTGANRVAVGCKDGSILLHDLSCTDDEPASKLLGHQFAVSSLCLLSEHVLASGSYDRTVRSWNLRTKEVLQVLRGHTHPMQGLARLSDTQLASASADNTIRLWNLAEPEEDGRVLEGHSNTVFCLCRTTAGSLVSESEDRTLRVWDLDTGEELQQELRGHTGGVNCLVQASAGLLASGSSDNTVRLWDLTSWTTVRVLKGLSSVESLCLLAPNHLAAADTDGGLRVWCVDSAEPVHDVKIAHSESIRALTVTKVRGEHVLCSGSEDSALKLWQLQAWGIRGFSKDPSELRSISHDSNVACVCATGANFMAVGCTDGSIRLHDLSCTDDEPASKLLGHQKSVRCLCLLSEHVLASGSEDETVRTWNLRSKEALQVLSGHSHYVWGLARLSDTQLASAGSDKTIRLWSLSEPEARRVLRGHAGFVSCLCRTTAGSLVSGSSDATLRVWDSDTGAELQEMRGHTDVVICLCEASAELLASGSVDNTVRLWDLTSWTTVRVLEGFEVSVYSLCLLAPNHVAAGDKDGRLIVWAVQSGEKVHDVKRAHRARIYALTVTKVRGEHVLCSGSEDLTLKLWQLQAGGKG
ncbi:unnamed protein product, partial [Symbiodinium necroappetens]